MEREFLIFARIESGMPKVVTVASPNSADKLDRQFALSAHIPYEAQPNGLPAKGQLTKATDAEEELKKVLLPYNALHMGHITFNGRMRVIFYASKPGPQFISIRKGLFSKLSIQIDSREDPEWNFYDLEFKPTPLEIEENRNRQLFQVLANKGDVASLLRPVDFAAKFPSAEQRASFVEAVAADGYLSSAKPYWEPAPGDFWCELVKTTNIEPEVINMACLYLRETAQSHGGEFDGWGTPITQ